MALNLARIARSLAPARATDRRLDGKPLRPEQLPPEGAWSTWLLLGGRGSGKSLGLNNQIIEWAEDFPRCRIGIGARTMPELREELLYGESGLLTRALRPPQYLEQRRRLVWPNGSIARLFSADEPRQGRGPNLHFFAADEVMAWHRPERPGSLWFNLKMATRLPARPEWERRPGSRGVAATTPLPNELLRQLVAKASAGGPVRVSRLRTLDNAENLAPEFLDDVLGTWEGTRWGRQELDGELLEDAEGALWSREINIDPHRCKPGDVPPLVRRVVSVDPSGGDGEGDACGITAQGVSEDGHIYVLDDRTVNGPPEAWARAVVDTRDTWKADLIVAEGNYGDKMVRSTIWGVDPSANVQIVHARDGKRARAMPIAVIYDKGFVHHVGHLKKLEDEMCGWASYEDPSPNRIDALVWGCTHLLPYVHTAMRKAAREAREAAKTAAEKKREQHVRDAEEFRRNRRARDGSGSWWKGG